MQEIGVSLLLFYALALDFMLGDPKSAWHPVCLMGRLGYAIEARLRHGKNDFFMFLKGFIAYILVVVPWVLLAIILVHLANSLWTWLGYGVSIIAIYICIAPRSLAEHARAVQSPLEKGDLVTARTALSMIVGREVASLDEHGIARAAVESVAENFVDGILSSFFWASVGFICFGTPGAAGFVVWHRASNVLDAQWGKKNEKYIRFGTFAARMDDALNYIPARLSLPLIALACFFVRGAKARSALQVGHAYRYAHQSPNSAWSEAAFAGAFDLQLGGKVVYAGLVVEHPTLGCGTDKVTPTHLAKTVRLMWATSFVSGIIFTITIFICETIV